MTGAKEPYILGLWDGHDAGVAVVKGHEILFAINEERLSRRKLEIGFPYRSIEKTLRALSLRHKDIAHIAISTGDFAKTLTRLFPHLQEEYYQIRRRKKKPQAFDPVKKRWKYWLTEFGPHPLWESLTTWSVKRNLRRCGWHHLPPLYLFKHHACHAAGAAFCSGFDSCLVITLDGIGDGLSGTVSSFQDHRLTLLSTIQGSGSLGIFFEHVTNLLNMRELEDEGKVMALASYAQPSDDRDNPLLPLISIEGLTIQLKYSGWRLFQELRKELWHIPYEEFAYLAQRALEVTTCRLVQNAIAATGLHKVAFSGGVASNIKVNTCVEALPEVEELFVFPHMGDGGLALGAAMWANYSLYGVDSYELRTLALGPEFSSVEIQETLERYHVRYSYQDDIVDAVVRLIAQGHIVLWFQGRMEVGPRALGQRSILALANSKRIRDELNLRLKKRVWYQPFCPTMLGEEAELLLVRNGSKPDPFMTMSYQTLEEGRRALEGVIHIDGTCRPQILTDEETRYAKLLRKLKEITGHGVVLNTSFNIHGEPIVCTPDDAIDVFRRTRSEYLAIGDFLAYQSQESEP